MTTRREARRTALDILYQADVTEAGPTLVLDGWMRAGRQVDPFAADLVRGVEEHQPEIDLLLEEHAEGWSVSRMTSLDRSILRVGIFELRHRPDVPASVAISEAVEAASALSGEGAPRFVNGILGRIASEMRPAQHAPPASEAGPDGPPTP